MTKTFALPWAVAASLGLAACAGADDAPADAAESGEEAVEKVTIDEAVADMEATADKEMAEMEEMVDDAGEAVDDAMGEEEATE